MDRVFWKILGIYKLPSTSTVTMEDTDLQGRRQIREILIMQLSTEKEPIR